MINWHEKHLDKARTEMRAILMQGATIEQFKNGNWPAGSLWLWALGVVGPKGSAVQPDKRTGTE
jgi:hypothetical protein